MPHDQRLHYLRQLNRPGLLQIIALPICAGTRNYPVGNPSLRPGYVLL